MIRICTSLSDAGYKVMLVGVSHSNSPALLQMPFTQKRISCFFKKGKLFYAEYNLRLFFFLLFRRVSGVCAIDLDTILPCYFVSVLKKVPRIYDAHELFCEMKEVATRPFIYKIWKSVERFAVPRFAKGYTVNEEIADEFAKMYNVKYEVIRNIPRSESFNETAHENYLLYQGAVNEGRAFETLLPAMKKIKMPLWICGEGNFFEQAKRIVAENNLGDRVIFKGRVAPQALKQITRKALLGFTLFDKEGKSNFYSLANRFFDYIHAHIPQVCVNYPVYNRLNKIYETSVLIDDVESDTIANAVNMLIDDQSRWMKLKENTMKATLDWNWQNEQLKLISFYRKIFG